MHRKPLPAGFSLVELMVVLALVAILAGLATPSLIAWQQSRRLNGAVTNLTADLEMAKMRAIRENSFVAMTFTVDGYTIFVDNGAGSGDPGTGCAAATKHWCSGGRSPKACRSRCPI